MWFSDLTYEYGDEACSIVHKGVRGDQDQAPASKMTDRPPGESVGRGGADGEG